MIQFFMGLGYISQSFKGEIGRLKASWLFGWLVILVSLLCIIGVANLLNFHLPILLLIPQIIADFILGSKLSTLCFERISYKEFSINGFFKYLTVTAWYLILAIILIAAFLILMFNILKYSY